MKKINVSLIAIIISASFFSNIQLSAMGDKLSEEWKNFFKLVESKPEKKEVNGRLLVKIVTTPTDDNGVLVTSEKWEDLDNLVPKDKDGRCPEPFGRIKHTLEEKEKNGPRYIRVESTVVQGEEVFTQTTPPTDDKK